MKTENNISILILEDDTAHAEAIRRALDSSEKLYNIIYADSLSEYYAKTKDFSPDIVLADLKLPDGKAIDILQDNKNDRRWPVIVITAYGDEEIAVRAIKTGALDYIVKSVDSFKEIDRLIERALREWDNLQKRKLAEEALKKSEEKNKALLNANPDMMFILSGDGIFLDYKSNYSSGLLLPIEEFLGKNIRDIMPKEIAEITMKKINLIKLTGNSETIEYMLDIKGEHYYECRLFSYFKDEFLAIVRDITERKKQEEELKAAKENAEEMNRLKSIFFANMSHELRTPLVALLGFSELLESELTDEYYEYAKSINRSGKRLLRTLNTILDYSEIEFEKLTVENRPVQIMELLREEMALYKILAQQKGLYIRENFNCSGCQIYSDEKLLRGILDNLINNAVKFTDSGGITVALYQESGSMVVIIADTGIGIPNEKLELIFEEFRQASEGSTRTFQGTGLGLTIVKKYVELLKGSISVESQPGIGSSFKISLPFQE